MPSPDRARFHALAAEFTVVPVWRELLADLITPVAAFARLCRDDEPGFLLESVEHGDRWSRWSFVGRRAAATFTARGLDVTVDHTVPDSIPLDRGMLAATEAVLACYRAPSLDELPPLHSGLMGYLGYDVVREVEHLPDAPPDDQDLPDAVQSIIGELAAFDHFRQRVTLVANAWIPAGATTEELDRVYDEAVGRLDQLALDGASPLDEPLVEPPARAEEIPDVTSPIGLRPLPPVGGGGQGAHPGRRRVPDRAVAALRPAARRRPVRLLPGAPPGEPEPLHVLRAAAAS